MKELTTLEQYKQASHQCLAEACVIKDNRINQLEIGLNTRISQLEEIRKFIGSNSELSIVYDLKKFYDNSGDKVKMKARLKKLEEENSSLKIRLYNSEN